MKKKPAKSKKAKPTGRPPKEVNLKRVTDLARLGLWKPSLIARVIGVPKQTILGPKHRDSVMEAIEDGRALFELEALQQYDRACRGGKVDKAVFALAIFKMKQIGWSDRITTANTTRVELEMEGAPERFLALIDQFMKANPPTAEQGV